MKKSVENLKEILEPDGKIPDNDSWPCCNSLDVAWQKRYEFNSLHGVIFLKSVLNGEAFDYIFQE